MSLKTQAKVLRVLQEQELERLGSNRIIKVDVRVIAATNKNLEEEITKGTFREDLFYRLNVIPIYVPPLRERKDDIAALIRHFADLFTRENNFRRKTFTAAGMERLRQHHWRGNIRELRNFVERIIIMSPAEQIDARDMPDFSGARPVDMVPSSAMALPTGASSPPPPMAETAWVQRADPAGVQVDLRARVPRQQAAREWLEHLEDGGSDRHAAQQSLQETRAVSNHPGIGRVTPCARASRGGPLTSFAEGAARFARCESRYARSVGPHPSARSAALPRSGPSCEARPSRAGAACDNERCSRPDDRCCA